MLKGSLAGFTLIELMIVLAIIGVLAAIAIPMYADILAKTKESTTKGNLGTIRSALAIYYGDLEGAYPIDIGNLSSLTTAGKYLAVIPPVNLPYTTNNIGHPLSSVISNSAIDDSSAYYYANGGLSQPSWGQFVVNCTHKDLAGSSWTAY